MTEQSKVMAARAVSKPLTASDLFHEIAATFSKASESNYPRSIEAAIELFAKALRKGHKLLLFGNGGSATDAQHLSAELVVRFRANRRALPAVALCCDAAVMTACGNDFSYDDVFARQIEALGQHGDVALGFSTSGNSANVVKALRTARERGLVTALMTGPNLGLACQYCDLVLAAPGANTARIQELHVASYHVICEALDVMFSRETE